MVCSLIDDDTAVKMLWTDEAQPGYSTTNFEREMKKVMRETRLVWHIDAGSVVWTLVDNGKLANQIVRLVAIVVKK